MTKRRLWFLLAAAGLGLAAWFYLWLSTRPGITDGNYQRIQEGMTRAQVQRLLGGPPGNYSQIPNREAGLWTIDLSNPDLNREFFIGREVWIGDGLAVAVWFDEEERVLRKKSYATPERRFLEWFRNMLGW